MNFFSIQDIFKEEDAEFGYHNQVDPTKLSNQDSHSTFDEAKPDGPVTGGSETKKFKQLKDYVFQNQAQTPGGGPMNSLPPGLANSASKAKAKTLSQQPMPTFTLPYNFTDFQRTEAESFNPQQSSTWANQSDQQYINTPNSKRKLSLEGGSMEQGIQYS